MHRLFTVKTFVFALFAVAAGSLAFAGQPVVSTMANVNAVMEARGFRIVPVNDVAVTRRAGDEAPSQTFEIIRPRGEKITIGRLNTSCSCVRLEAPKTTFERGERALVTLRNVKPTPRNGQMYAFYIQINSPIRTTLRQDTYVQSDRFRQAAPTVHVARRPSPRYVQSTPRPIQQTYVHPVRQPARQYADHSLYRY